MPRSYDSLDKEFANGFLAEIVQQKSFEDVFPKDHCRPIASLKSEHGKIKGDVGLFARKGPKEYIIIIEREGSAPGNERNILKWFVAVKGSHNISLKGRTFSSNSIQTRVCLAFHPTRKWKGHDFYKTVEFCQTLSEVFNKYAHDNQIPFEVLVPPPYSNQSTDLRLCGRYFAREVARLLK